MAWPTVTVKDLTDRWRPLTDDETLIAEQRLQDAGVQLRTDLRLRGVTGVPVFDDAEELADWQQLYVTVVVGAVKNELKNPDGWRSEREEIDDYGRTLTRAADDRSGDIWFDPDDIDRLVPRPRRRRGAFSVRLGQS